MKRRYLRLAVVGVLTTLAVALAAGIVLLQGWGGRIEAELLVFGDRVWVIVDTGRPRLLLLLLIPGILLGAAFSLYRRRPTG